MVPVRSDPRRRRSGRWLWIPAAGVSAAVTAAAARRLALVRATTDEKNSLLPGDELVDRPTIVATRGIDIAAPPEAVWPWVAQLGQERGGFYTYAWLENLVGCRMVNADRMNPQWQDVAVGDIVRLHPDLGLRVAVSNPAAPWASPATAPSTGTGKRWWTPATTSRGPSRSPRPRRDVAC